ncbi:glycosyltransferase family 2 protein [bacterium]|nr:glycosyltransferase family 2 protein [bacterium]
MSERINALGGKMNPIQSRKQPRVSIIIAIYNVADFLPKCLESIKQQSLMPKEYEVIIVDDQSTDDSLNIAKKFQFLNDNVVIIENEQNIGPGKSRNVAIESAKGEYLYFLDGDDYLDPVAIETMLMAAIDNNSDLVVSGFIRVTEDGREIYRSNFSPSITVNKIILMKKVFGYDVSSMIGNRLIKKSVFTRNQIEFPSGLHEDFSIIYKLFYLANNVFVYPDYFYYWVQRKGSTVDTISTKHIDGIINGLRSRTPFLINNSGKGFLRKVDPDLHKGIFRAAHQMYRRIINCEGLEQPERVDLFFYLGNKILGLNEGYESIISFSHYDKNFVDLFTLIHAHKLSKISTSKLKPLLSKKLLPKHLNNNEIPELSTEDRLISKSIFIRLINLLKSVKNHPGTIVTKLYYLLKRIKGYIKQRLNKFVPDIEIPKRKYNYEVLFVCDADYHLRNAAPIIRKLKKKGYTTGIIDRSNYLVDGKRKLNKDEKKRFQDIDLIPFNTNTYDLIDASKLRMILYYNDWGDNNKYVRHFRNLGIKTVGINEGVNDFLKLGEGFTSKVSPYRTCEYVILPGKFDTQFFTDRPDQWFIGGLPKIRELYNETVKFPSTPIAVINVNFTYGVLTYHRNLFLKTAIEGCKKAGIDYIITQHPMDIADLSGYKVSKGSMYDTIRNGTIFISRFSGAIIEALALGKPCVYHNPHNEQILKFQEPLNAFSISYDTDSLASSIKKELNKIKRQPVREYADEFLKLHANISDPIKPNNRTTQILTGLLNNKKTTI